MEHPQVEQLAGVFKLSWPDERISVRVDRIQSHHETVAAEFTITAGNTSNSGHLHIGRLNLTSTRERQILVNRLKERWDVVEWDVLIEQACLVVLSEYRRGEPEVDLADVVEEEPVTERLAPFLLRRQPTVLYGFGGSGKSLFATYLGLLACAGASDPRTGLRAEPGVVLYLDWEGGPGELRQRIRGLCAAGGLPHPKGRFIYRRCCASLASEIETIQRLRAEHKADLVIVDSVGLACGGEPEKAESVLTYFRALRALEAATLNIDHLAKGGDGRNTSPFGSVYKTNMARSVWECRRGEGTEDDGFVFGLFHRKANFSRLEAPRGYRLRFGTDGIDIKRENLSEDPELSQGMRLQDRIANALRTGKMTVKQLAETIGMPEPSIRTALHRLKERRFTQLGNEWGLYEADDKTVEV